MQSNPTDILRHFIRVMRRQDLTEKIPTYLNTYRVGPTPLPTYQSTFLPGRNRQEPGTFTNKEQPKRPVTFEIFDQSDEET